MGAVTGSPSPSIGRALVCVACAMQLSLSSLSLASTNPSRHEWSAASLEEAKPQFATVRRLGIPVQMSDGVMLVADVTFPADLKTGQKLEGEFPVLLTQTPYLNFPSDAGDYFVKRGYIYVIAYVRGTTKSGGEFGFFSGRDAQDGAELVRWAARLPESNGIVGLHGGSYMGITQFFTLAALGSGSPVRALDANCMGAEFYRETYFSGGMPTQTLNFQRVIQGGMGRNTGPSGAEIVRDIERGGEKAYYSTFWKSRTVGEFVGRVAATRVPILLWSSNNDIYAQSSLELYTYLQNAGAGRPPYGPMSASMTPSPKYQIFMSQGGHCQNMDERVQLEWFDHWLKGKESSLARTDRPIHIHEQVSNEWINEARYPITERYTKEFLTGSGGLTYAPPKVVRHGRVTWAPPEKLSQLTFESASLPKPMRLAGPIGASLVASSTTRNLALIASLELVAADGTATKLTSGSVVASLSANDPTRSWVAANGGPMRPYGKYVVDDYPAVGSRHRYDFAISSRFVRIPAGSRLRLVVTTQTPSDKCTPPLGTDPCFPTAPQKASLSGGSFNVYYGGASASYLNLPLLDAR